MPEHEDYAEACDYEALRRGIAKVLRRCFERDDNGDPNEEYDENFSDREALDAIHQIVGDI